MGLLVYVGTARTGLSYIFRLGFSQSIPITRTKQSNLLTSSQIVLATTHFVDSNLTLDQLFTKPPQLSDGVYKAICGVAQIYSHG